MRRQWSMKKTGASRGRGILGPGHLPLQDSFHQAPVTWVFSPEQRTIVGVRFRRTAAGLEMKMEERGTMEVVGWVLGFGEAAVVVEPAELRAHVAGELARAAGRYRD